MLRLASNIRRRTNTRVRWDWRDADRNFLKGVTNCLKCLDCKYVEITEHGANGLLGESIIDCQICNNITGEMENCDDFVESSEKMQERLKCYEGFGVYKWDCYKDCAFWDGKECTKNKTDN